MMDHGLELHPFADGSDVLTYLASLMEKLPLVVALTSQEQQLHTLVSLAILLLVVQQEHA